LSEFLQAARTPTSANPGHPAPAQLAALRAAASRGPLARLIRNPSPASGSPPFALADRAGTIQRLVEPTPGIDLEPYVGEVVIVRHDTGPTLLATQLELPPRPLLPVGTDAAAKINASDDTSTAPSLELHRLPVDRYSGPNDATHVAVFIDDDDSTTQIISDQDSTNRSLIAQPNAGGATTTVQESRPTDQTGSGATISGQPSPQGPILGETLRSDPLHTYPAQIESWPGGEVVDGLDVCPQCGGYHASPDCGPLFDGAQFPASTRVPNGRFCSVYAEAQVNFLRVHLMEGAVGKLSEDYQFSPRFVIGFEETGIFDGRVRYWIYDRSTNILSGGGIGVKFSVLDLEATHRFQAGRSGVVMAAGMRLAGIDLEDRDGEQVGSDLIGMTLAADAKTPIYAFAEGTVSLAYGGRLSILGGDWGGDGANDFVPAPLQDDNVIADEIYAGIEFVTGYRECDLRVRIAFEMQNWHSDVLAQNAGSDSIGFIGPGVHVGAAF
jgi:hypothetical protein